MAHYIGNTFWGINDIERFKESSNQLVQSLKYGRNGLFFADQLFTWGRNLSFLDNDKFFSAFRAHSEDPMQSGLVWRRAVHFWAAYHCLNLKGDFVECGVWKGTAVHVIIDATDFVDSDKSYWLYDIFDHKEGDQHHALPGLEEGLFQEVTTRFSFAPNVKIIRGYIPKSFEQGTPDAIALMHIDMNNADAEIAALENLWDKVVPGGIVLLDDFGWTGYSEQTVAEMDFFDQRGYLVLELPTGQGLVIKRDEALNGKRTKRSKIDPMFEETYARMDEEFKFVPHVFQPAPLWREIVQMYRHKDVYRSFKRNLNTSYSHKWVTSDDDANFQRVAALLGSSVPNELPLFEDSGWTWGANTAKVYAAYVAMLNQYAESKDFFGGLKQLEEPEEGDPVRVRWEGRLVSQDIAVSFLDYLAILQEFPQTAVETPTILELGGGYGCLASIFGRLTKAHYWMVDLPLSLAVAQVYISRIFPDKKLFCYRHFDSYEEVKAAIDGADICFFTPNQLELLPDKSVDLSLNVNTFSDMTPDQVEVYSALLSRVTAAGMYFRNELYDASNDSGYRHFRDKKWACPSIESYLFPDYRSSALREWELDPAIKVWTYRGH